MITQTQLHDLFTYSDGQLYWKVKKASRVKIGDKAGWVHHTGYTCISIDDEQYLLHRLVFLYHHGFLPKYIDHINRDRTNSRIENLRGVTNSQNRVNSDKTWTKNGYRGVKETRNGQFEARITRNGEYFHLGTYETPEEASEVYQNARKELFPGVHTR